MRADDPRLLGIPRSRPTIARADPHHGGRCKISEASRPRPAQKIRGNAPCTRQCSARAAPDIEGHHRPVIASHLLRIAPAVVLGGWNLGALAHSAPDGTKPPDPPQTNPPRSRSLTELTRQITPPTKNGHAPPPIESRKSFNLSILTMSGPGKFSRVGSN